MFKEGQIEQYNEEHRNDGWAKDLTRILRALNRQGYEEIDYRNARLGDEIVNWFDETTDMVHITTWKKDYSLSKIIIVRKKATMEKFDLLKVTPWKETGGWLDDRVRALRLLDEAGYEAIAYRAPQKGELVLNHISPDSSGKIVAKVIVWNFDSNIDCVIVQKKKETKMGFDVENCTWNGIDCANTYHLWDAVAVKSLLERENLEVVDFREVKPGETYLGASSGRDTLVREVDSRIPVSPRFIVQPKPTYVYTETKTVKPEDVYGNFDQKVLDEYLAKDNYKIVDFRPPVEEEIFVSTETFRHKRLITVTEGYDEPRFILKKTKQIVSNKSATVTLKDVYGTEEVEIPEGWKFREFNVVRNTQGEMCLTQHGSITKLYAGGCFGGYPRIILDKA